MTRPKNFELKLDTLRRHTTRLNRMLEDGSFYDLPFWKRYRLVRRVSRLYRALIGPLPVATVRTILAATSVFVLGATCPGGGGGAPIADNPSFASPVQNPFGLSSVGSFNATPTLVDYDGDGDIDLFVHGDSDRTKYFENQGSSTNPSFSGPIDVDTLGDNLPWAGNGVYEAVYTFADMDDDGDLDIFAGNNFEEVYYFRNDGTRTSPTYTNQLIPPGLPAGSAPYHLSPTCIDLDGDGDFDMVIGETTYGSGVILYYRNGGSQSAFSFSSQPNPPGLTSSDDNPVPRFIDIDADGDLDAFIGLTDGSLSYQENNGSETSPSFAASRINPFGLSSVSGYAAPDFADIDGDGDYDAFVGDDNGNVHFFENTNL